MLAYPFGASNQRPRSPLPHTLVSASTHLGQFILSSPCCPSLLPAAPPPQLSLSPVLSYTPGNTFALGCPGYPFPALTPRTSSGKPRELSPHILFFLQWATSNYQDRNYVLEQHRTRWKLFLTSDTQDVEEERTPQVPGTHHWWKRLAPRMHGLGAEAEACGMLLRGETHS